MGKPVNEMPYRDDNAERADNRLIGVPPAFSVPNNTQEESYIERMIRQDRDYEGRTYDD